MKAKIINSLEIEINDEKITLKGQAIMQDCGEIYKEHFTYTDDDGEECDGYVEYDTNEEWEAEKARYAEDLKKEVDSETGQFTDYRADNGFLDQEDMACDWDKFRVCAEDGEILASKK